MSTQATNTHTPRQVVADLHSHPRLAHRADERFAGYGVMGTPFASGDYLALRDMVASSIGPAYRAVWHRDPHGQWTIYTTGDPDLSCPRYFGTGATTTRVPAIDVEWTDDWTFDVTLAEVLRWRVELASSTATRMMTAMSAATPAVAWRSSAVLSAMGPMATSMLRAGRIRLCGRTPNGPQFRAAPLHVWRVAGSLAQLRGHDLGTPTPLDVQTRLGDFWLPQRGLFFVGRVGFDAPHAAERTDPVHVAVG